MQHMVGPGQNTQFEYLTAAVEQSKRLRKVALEGVRAA